MTVGATGQSCLLLLVPVKSVDISVTTSLTGVDDTVSIRGDTDELIKPSAFEDSSVYSNEVLYVKFGVADVSNVVVSVISVGIVVAGISDDTVEFSSIPLISISALILDSSLTVTF